MINSQIKLRVNYTFSILPEDAVIAAGGGIEGAMKLIREGHPKLRQFKTHNIIPDIFFVALARRIGNLDASTYTFVANKIAVGDNATAVANTDIALGNETHRGDFSIRNASGNVAYLDKYWGSIEVGGSIIKEAGIFIDGSSGIGSAGLLLSHVNLNETLTATESFTINATITITNA